MALPRESTFLPTIKCSQCGNEVEISLMGEHLCVAPATPELSPPLEGQETFESAYQSTRNKYMRTPPPVDTRAANRYLHSGQLTPNSQSSSSRNASPKTPNGRSGTHSRRYNDDDYAPEIASQDDRGYGRRPGGYGGFNSQPAERDDVPPQTPPKDAPAVGGFFQRINELAGGYGGFGARTEPAEPEKPAQEEEPAPEAPGFLQRINDLAGAAFDAGRRPAPPTKAPLPQRKESLDRWEPPPDLVVNDSNSQNQKPVRQNGYGGFNSTPPSDQAQTQGSRGIPRSETFPRPGPSSGSDMSGRRPSAQGIQSDMNRRPSAPSAPYQRAGDINRRPSMSPDTSRRPPPRTSLIKHKASHSSVDLDAEFGARNPYHTPTDSMSSGYSSHSDHSTKSSSSASAGRLVERNKSDPVSRPRQQQPPPQQLPQQQRQQQPPQQQRQQQPPRQPPQQQHQHQQYFPEKDAPPRRDNNARPDLRIDPAIQAPQRGPGRYIESHSPYTASPRDDRYDPAIQHGVSAGGRGNNQYDSPPRQHGFGGYGANDRSDRYGAPAPPSAPVRQGSRDPLNVPSRGDCKACRMPITGKSISSADGRLTGKYHKACFVCTTCTMPFTSAEFYVHRDQPYCEIHYHKLNGSLCGSCDRGIEGQYLEDEVRVKYHVGCFRCLDCGMSLSDGYFEVEGKSYCERDAWRRIESATNELPPMPPAEPEYNQQPPPLPNGNVVPPPSNRAPAGRGMAPRGAVGAQRGPYGVSPGTRPKLNKRMTRIGMM